MPQRDLHGICAVTVSQLMLEAVEQHQLQVEMPHARYVSGVSSATLP